MTYEKWIEEIEMRGIKPDSIDRLSLAVAFKQGWTPAQVAEYETKKNAAEEKKKNREAVGLTISTFGLIKALTACGLSIYLIALGTTIHTLKLIGRGIDFYRIQSARYYTGPATAALEETSLQVLGFFFVTVFLVFTATMILLLSKSVRRNAERFDADLW